MLSKWKKSACAETAQSSRRKHRADIANRLTWSGPNDTEHEAPFLLSHLSERGGPPAACFDWDTPPRPRQRLPAEAKEGRLLCGLPRAGGGAVTTPFPTAHVKFDWSHFKWERSLYCNAIRQMSRYEGKRLACPQTTHGQQRQLDIPAFGRSASDQIELLSIT